jgi:hypothetical protein
MAQPEVFGVSAPGLGVTLVTLFIRWRIGRVPHYISTPGVAIGIGTIVLSGIPNAHPATWAAGLVGVALLAFAVEWQISRPPPLKPAPTNTQAVQKQSGSVVSGAQAGSAISQAASVSPLGQPVPERYKIDTGPARTVTVEHPLVEHRLHAHTDVHQEASVAMKVVQNQPDVGSAQLPRAPQQPGSLSRDQERDLVSAFYQLKPQIDGVWLTQTTDGGGTMFGQIEDMLFRAGINFVTDSQPPSNPDQTGIVICIDDPAHPNAAAQALSSAFQKAAGISTTYDIINQRQRSRNDHPSLVIFVAPAPL